MALTKATYAMIDSAPVNIMDWIPTQYHAAIRDFSSTQPVHTYIQAAMDSGAGSIYFPMGRYNVSSPIYVTNGQPGSNQAANLTLIGENRTSTYIWANEPFAAAPFNNPITGQPVKSIFINQSDNGKFSLKNLRFQGQINLGHVLYALEDGVNSQCIFSGEILDCWPSLSSTNGGFFYGGMQNFVVANNTFEQMKACFRLVGAGCGDINFSNNSVFASYDPFISANEDAQPKNFINVSNLNVYQHYRGPVFAGQNAQNWHISNVTLQADTSSPLGTLGLCEFVDSGNITIDGFSTAEKINDAIKISGSSVKLSNGYIAANDSGVYVTSNNSVNLTIDNVDIKESEVSAFYHPANNPGGIIKVSNCAWYNSKGNFWLDQSGAATYNVTFDNCRFTNAGFPNTSAGARNFDISTSGNVNFYDCLIGRTTTDALANFYILAGGTGDFVLTDSTFTSLAAPAGVGNEISGTQVFKIAGGLGNRYRQYYASAAPTTGTWSVGDRVFNSVPSIGQPKGWICTVAGTPGTWVSEGNL